MTNDDESFLTAFMDGELDPEQQQRVEAAVAASPHLAERLRGLSSVRGMVAGLPHDGWADVSARVVQEIQARRRGRGFLPTLERWRSGSRRILPLAGLATSAAALMIAASLALLLKTTQLERGAGPLAGLSQRRIVEHDFPASIPVQDDSKTISSVLEAPFAPSHSDIAGALAERTVSPLAVMRDRDSQPVLDASELSQSATREPLRRLLDDPSLKRFFLVHNGPKNDSEQAVASVVEHTTRLDFFKITVSQGIVIDPRHPDAATVFAFALEPNQVDRFHDQLEAALPGLVNQTALDPAIATALVDISEVKSLPPTLLAEVEISREALALRTRASVDGERLHNEAEVVTPRRQTGRSVAPSERKGDSARVVESPSRSNLASAKASSPASRDRASDSASRKESSGPPDRGNIARSPAKPNETVVVLVWVASPPAR